MMSLNSPLPLLVLASIPEKKPTPPLRLGSGQASQEGIVFCSPPWRGGRRPGWVPVRAALRCETTQTHPAVLTRHPAQEGMPGRSLFFEEV